MSDSTEFLFPGSIWFLAQKPTYKNLDELRRVVLQGHFENNPSSTPRPLVYAFSDQDLAERFLKKAGKTAGPYVVLALPDDEQLFLFLEELQRHGHEYLGVDAETSSLVYLPIPRVIEQVRRREPPTPPGSGGED